MSINLRVDNENVVHIHNVIFSSYKEKWNHDFWRKMAGAGGHCVKQNKAVSERQLTHPQYAF